MKAMKKFTSILSIILALLMIASAFVACDNTGIGKESGNETPAETPGETPVPEKILQLASGGRCNYTVVRPELSSEETLNAAKLIRDALVNAGAADASIKEDFLYGDMKPADLEILVGQTNREESAKALADAKYDDYMVSVDGNKIVINSYNDEQVIKAAEYFVSAIKAEGEELTFSNADETYYAAEYPMDEITVGGRSLMGYRIVHASNATATIKNTALGLQQEVIRLCGIYMPIVGDGRAEVDKELLLGTTRRETGIDPSSLEKYSYAIKTSGDKIVVATSDNDFTFIKFMEIFMKEIESGSVELFTGKLEVSDAPILTSMCFSDVHNNFAMLQENNSSGDYVVRRNVDWMIDHLLETEGAVDVVMVGGDYMSDYPSWNTSGSLPYKYYLGFKAKTIETFNRLAKDGKVMYVAGNHDYAQGEAARGGPGKNGTYNSFDFYFDGPMDETLGELSDSDKFVKVGEHTGEQYLLGYYYKVNGVHFVGFSPDPDMIWSEQGYGFNKEQLEWLDNKLDEIDPTGTEVIFVNCHYALSQRVTSSALNSPYIDDKVTYDFAPILSGHKNLFYMFGHWHTFNSYHQGTTVKSVLHYNQNGSIMNIKGTETESTQVSGAQNRSFTAVWMGGFRLDWSLDNGTTNADKFNGDFVTGHYTHPSTGTPRMAQGMYIEVYADKVVFQMKNIGDYPGFSTEDILEPYTVYLYK